MMPIRFGVVLVGWLALVAVAEAQPGKAPAIIQFKQFGATPEQFYQSSVTRWTGQLVLDLEAVKAESAAAKIAPAAKVAIAAQADLVIRHTAELDALVRRGVTRDKLYAEFAEVEKSIAGLTLLLNQNPPAKIAAAAALLRADTAYHQLASALGVGDNDPARLKRRLVRLGDALDDNTEDLRILVAEQIGGLDRTLERALGIYARESRLLSRRVRDDANADLIKQTYALMGERWAEVVVLLGRARGLPPAIIAQAVKVDGLHRRAATVLNLPPFPAGVNPLLPVAKPFSFAIGAGPGAAPQVNVYADEKGTIAYAFLAYDKTFDGGVRVDMADLNGDGIPDLIVSPGPSKVPVTMPVKVYDGRDMHLLLEFTPFPAWKGALRAVGTDLTKEGKALIAVTPEASNHIKVFDLAQGKEVADFFAHDPKVVTGGVRLAWGDLNGDGLPDLLTVNGPSNLPTTVKVFSGKDASVIAEFLAVDNKYKQGAFIAAADFTGNGQANPVVGVDGGTIPLVRIFDPKGKMVGEFLAYDEKFKGGVRVAVSARNHVVTGPGAGMKNSEIRIFDLAKPKAPVSAIVPFPGFDAGLHVGGR